jgi:pSer/pThr/pTyr-binding forkhead associated (FHA) protein
MDDEAPRLLVSLDGKISQEIRLDAERMLLGRSDLSDVVIDDPIVSLQHALMVRDQDRVILIDLKSENGTYVNSIRVQRRVLRDNDIITLGDHRIKVIYANSQVPGEFEDPDLADTARMQDIVDARRVKGRKELPLIAIRGESG